MGRPLKIQKVLKDLGFPQFSSLDQPTSTPPTGMTGSQFLGVVGGQEFPASASATFPIVEVQASLPGGAGAAFIITQKGVIKYLVSGVDTVNATGMTPGFSYIINTLGTTNWTAVGAGVNPQVGDVFTALKVGTGSGTVSDCAQCILVSGVDGDGTAPPTLTQGQMYISFSTDGGTTIKYASKLTNKYIWDYAGNKFAVNFFAGSATTAGSGADKVTWTNGTGNYALAVVQNYTS